MQPLRVALAVDDPRREAGLLELFEAQDPPFRVGGRPCVVVQLCASVAELRGAVAGETTDVVVASATLNAIPFETLRDLAAAGRPLVVLAPDPTAARWERFPGPVLPADPDGEALVAALSGGSATRPRRARSSAAGDRTPTPGPSTSTTALPAGVVAVASAYAGDGKTTVAASLAFALGAATRAVLVDADTRASSGEFQFQDVDPARNVCLLAQRDLATPSAWDAALRKELQPMGAPSRGLVLCGVTKPSLRPLLTPAYLERLIAALRERYRYVVLDTSGAGWTVDDPELDRLLLRLADRVLLVLRPDTQGVARARRALRDWPHRDRVALVLNQAGLPGQEQRAEIEVALGTSVAAVLPADPRGVAAARARHRPVVCQPRCRLTAPLLELAGRIAGGGPIPLRMDEETMDRQSWWRRLPGPVLGLAR